jgi:cation:H+ antiporter
MICKFELDSAVGWLVSARMSIAAIVFLLLGLVLLVVSADWLVKGASRLASIFGISSLVIGLTVVAFGTSAPELAVSLMSAFKDQADLALGNVVGSNIFNVLLILGLSALIIPLVVAHQLVRIDVPVMIFASMLLWILGLDGRINRWEGMFLFSIVLAYTWFLIRQSRREKNQEVLDEYEAEFGAQPEKKHHWLASLGWVVIGVGGLVLGSKLLVDGAVEIAKFFGVSELIIGLTIVAGGTSLPEVATSVVAALRGERDIAVGNVVGSNIFNILCVVGLSSVIAPKGIDVASSALAFDIPFMVAIAVACLPVFFAGYQISRLNGGLFIGFYVAYLIYLIFQASGNSAFETYRSALVFGVLPLTAMMLVFMTVQTLRRRRQRAA